MTSRLGTFALVAAAIAALVLMQRTTPRYQDLTGPIPVSGRMQETVGTRLFDIDVEQVAFARQLVYTRFGSEVRHTSSGVWAIVTARLAARTQSIQVSQAAWLGPTGLRYLQSDRPGVLRGLPPHALEPGLPQRGRFVFEIRPDQAAGATLVVSEAYVPRLDAEAHVALDMLPREADGALAVQDTFDLDTPVGAGHEQPN